MPFGPVSGMVRADDSGVESTRSNQLCAAVAPTMSTTNAAFAIDLPTTCATPLIRISLAEIHDIVKMHAAA